MEYFQVGAEIKTDRLNLKKKYRNNKRRRFAPSRSRSGIVLALPRVKAMGARASHNTGRAASPFSENIQQSEARVTQFEKATT